MFSCVGDDFIDFLQMLQKGSLHLSTTKWAKVRGNNTSFHQHTWTPTMQAYMHPYMHPASGEEKPGLEVKRSPGLEPPL